MSATHEPVWSGVSLLRKTKSGKILYCIAYEQHVKLNIWKPGMVYLHATDDGDARLQYFHSQLQDPRPVRIVGVAPVIGVHAEDDNGDSAHV